MDANTRGLAAIAAAAESTVGIARLEGVTLITAGPSVEEHQAAVTAARAEGLAAGGTAERARIKAIVSSDKAKGREQLAQSLAFNTDLSAEQAIAVLADAPEAAKASRLDGLVPRPKVDVAEEAGAETHSARLAASMAALLAKKGLKPLTH